MLLYTESNTAVVVKSENAAVSPGFEVGHGRILKSDVSIAKNYLSEKEIRQLERAVTGYFDYIEDLIERENVFTMEEFEKSVNAFLEFRQYKILKHNGRISHKQALEKAYIRIGSESVVADATELKRLVMRGRNSSYDALMMHPFAGRVFSVQDGMD